MLKNKTKPSSSIVNINIWIFSQTHYSGIVLLRFAAGGEWWAFENRILFLSVAKKEKIPSEFFSSWYFFLVPQLTKYWPANPNPNVVLYHNHSSADSIYRFWLTAVFVIIFKRASAWVNLSVPNCDCALKLKIPRASIFKS